MIQNQTQIKRGMKIQLLAAGDKRHLLQRAMANLVLACCQSFMTMKVRVKVDDKIGNPRYVESKIIIDQNGITIDLPFSVTSDKLT